MKFNLSKFDPCREGSAYYETKDSFEQAWTDCHRGNWMVWMARELDVDNRLVTLAAALCLNTIRDFITDERSIKAIDTALAYGRGEIEEIPEEVMEGTLKALESAREQNIISLYSAQAVYHLMHETYISCLFPYVDEVIFKTTRSKEMSSVPFLTQEVITKMAKTEQQKNQMETANICREVLTDAVLKKVRLLS